VIKQAAIILALLLSFPTVAAAEQFTGANGAPSCLDEATVTERFKAVQNATITVDADEDQYKNVLAAINTVLGVGHEIHASHFQTVFMVQADGRKSALVMYGDEPDQFCSYVIFSADQVDEVSKLLSSAGA
jgi:predicted small secreted protein